MQDQIFRQRQSNDTIDLDIQLDKEYVKVKGIELRIIEENIASDSLRERYYPTKKNLHPHQKRFLSKMPYPLLVLN